MVSLAGPVSVASAAANRAASYQKWWKIDSRTLPPFRWVTHPSENPHPAMGRGAGPRSGSRVNEALPGGRPTIRYNHCSGLAPGERDPSPRR